MKFNITIDSQQNENQVGEYLRDQFFDQSNGEYGCYSTFNLRAIITKLPDTEIDEENWTCAYHPTLHINMYYHWDGDGVLIFEFEDGTCLINSDCKKDYNWQHWNSFKEYINDD